MENKRVKILKSNDWRRKKRIKSSYTTSLSDVSLTGLHEFVPVNLWTGNSLDTDTVTSVRDTVLSYGPTRPDTAGTLRGTPYDRTDKCLWTSTVMVKTILTNPG